ncbi:hypothetical protein PU630_13095 [Microbacterium horticulturae]|uniref:Uncharacterized protein n=1 Tax=Microbacterium horticulturae TaxID=3028316 RepID=A0ABY8BYH7_9MICO|nr:hypothetical protein [Microbacterium sp. KACC 23027]WEG08167.1 hypothetical protein PU630_13095 [Microbacterium sp. KACC 23027]
MPAEPLAGSIRAGACAADAVAGAGGLRFRIGPAGARPCADDVRLRPGIHPARAGLAIVAQCGAIGGFVLACIPFVAWFAWIPLLGTLAMGIVVLANKRLGAPESGFLVFAIGWNRRRRARP